MNEREIFSRAMQLDSDAERSAYLDEACRGDAQLHARIGQLLSERDALGSFLESPPPGITVATDRPAISERAGHEIGPYKLLQKLGDGGMGVVYMAEQREPVERRVALKIIKPGMDTEQVIARFEAERQALAMMDHQHIARVFDAGQTASGRPYFVMELVRGVPITDYCDHNKLTPRERLELIVPVCHAIQHAHQKGIIHRDIKPSNIMVTLYDGKPVPKIIDFGVAKATAQRLTEKTMFTQYGQIVGTLEYMSPEQAEMSALDIDTRSDVYSLGVLIYELLTGSTPLSMEALRRATLPEMLRLIREHEPERPSTRLSHSGDALPEISAQRRTDPKRLSALVRGELDWIVLKALEKERTRRYETASALARDIERYLSDEPVEACPPSTVYRLRKQLRRHRGPVAAASLLTASLVVGLVASLVLYGRAEKSRRHADTARAAEARTSAELRDALGARDDALREKSTALVSAESALQEKDAALRRSDALRLAAQSAAVLPEDPGLALVLAVESARREPLRTATQDNALFAALAQCRETRTLFPRMPGDDESAVRFDMASATYSRDGSRIVTLARGSEPRTHYRRSVRSNFRVDIGLAQVWDADGYLLATIMAPPHQKFAGAEVSPDGRWLAARFENTALVHHGASTEPDEWKACLYSDRVARLWDLATGAEVHVLAGHTETLTAVRFSPDGRRILTAAWDDTLRVWDAATGRELHRLEPGAGIPVDARFSPDGSRVLAWFAGMSGEVQYADGDPANGPVDEIDPPSGHDRGVAQVRDGEQGRGSRSISIRGELKLPLLGTLPLGSSGKIGLRMWSSDTFEEVSVTLAAAAAGASAPELVDVAFVADPARVILATAGGQVRVLGLDDGTQLAGFETGLDKTTSIALSHDGRRVAAVNEAGTIAVHDLADGRLLRTWDTWKAGDACFGATSDIVFAVHGLPAEAAIGESPRGRIVILDVNSGERLGWLKGHSETVENLRLSPRGTHVVTASTDGTARLWHADLEPGDSLVLPGFGPARRALFDPGGERILVTAGSPTAGDDWQGFGAVYDAETGEQLAVLADKKKYSPDSPLVRHGVGRVEIARFSSDGRRVLTVSDDRHVRMIDPDVSGAFLFTQTEDKWPVAEHLAYSPVRVWDAQTGNELFALEGLVPSVSWASFTPDGERMITLCRRNAMHVDLQQKNGETSVLSTRSGGVNDHQAQVHVWNGRTGELILELRDLLNPHIDLSYHGRVPLALSGDGKWLAITELNGVVDLDEGKRYSMPGIWSSSTPLFSPDDRYLLTHTQRNATLLDLQRLESDRGRFGGEMEVKSYGPDGGTSVRKIPAAYSRSYERRTVEGHDDTIRSAAFSADGRYFATTSDDRTVRVWTSATGELEHVLRGHPGPVHEAVFSPDGRYIATRSTDHRIRIFLVDSGREFATFGGHSGPVHSLVFSADSRRLLSASEDGTSRLWHVDPLDAAIARMPRELTQDESARFEVSPPAQPD